MYSSCEAASFGDFRADRVSTTCIVLDISPYRLTCSPYLGSAACLRRRQLPSAKQGCMSLLYDTRTYTPGHPRREHGGRKKKEMDYGTVALKPSTIVAVGISPHSPPAAKFASNWCAPSYTATVRGQQSSAIGLGDPGFPGAFAVKGLRPCEARISIVCLAALREKKNARKP